MKNNLREQQKLASPDMISLGFSTEKADFDPKFHKSGILLNG